MKIMLSELLQRKQKNPQSLNAFSFVEIVEAILVKFLKMNKKLKQIVYDKYLRKKNLSFL